MESVVREIQTQLEAIERDDTLYEEANFGGRQEALDAIEVSVLDRVKGLRSVYGEVDPLVALKGRAEAVQRRLKTSDDRLFCRLKAGIRSGALRGPELRSQLEAYAGFRGAGRVQDDGAYDSLDALVGGILLFGTPPGETADREPEMVAYQPTPARIIFELVEVANLGEHDTFYDLGSGLGQVVILVHLLSGVAARGVEVDPAYYEYARLCAQDLNLSGAEFVNADARDADFSDGTVFFLYTPFEGRMLQQVLGRLKQEAKTRTIHVYTYGPCTFAISRQDWLEPVGRKAHHIDSLAAFRSIRGSG